MQFDTSQILMISVAILISSVVQAAIGFAVALVAIPLLLNAGLSLPESILVVLVTATVQNLWGLRDTWSQVDIRSLIMPALLRISAIPPGFLLMQHFESLGRDQLRRIFGITLLIILILQIVIRLKPRSQISNGWTIFAMLVSGLAQGSIGTPGPPLAFWTMAHDWNTFRARGTLFFLFLTGTLPHLVMFSLSADPAMLQTATRISIGVLPVAMIGSAIGVWLGARFETHMLRRITLLTLFVLSMKLVLIPG